MKSISFPLLILWLTLVFPFYLFNLITHIVDWSHQTDIAFGDNRVPYFYQYIFIGIVISISMLCRKIRDGHANAIYLAKALILLGSVVVLFIGTYHCIVAYQKYSTLDVIYLFKIIAVIFINALCFNELCKRLCTIKSGVEKSL